MRAASWLLLALAGCKQIFGLSDPQAMDAGADAPGDMAIALTDTPIDGKQVLACDSKDTTLVACFDFEDSPADGSSYGVTSTTANLGYGPGMLGQALVQDATSVFMIADTTQYDVSAFTLEAWIRPAALPATGTRYGIWDTNAQMGFFLHADGSLSCSNSAGMNTFAAGILPSVWTHVACTADTSALVIYKNGSAILTVAGAPIASGANESAVAGNAPSGERFVGSVDTLRLFNVARSAFQIAADAAAP